jgi:hypothetical protein
MHEHNHPLQAAEQILWKDLQGQTGTGNDTERLPR